MRCPSVVDVPLTESCLVYVPRTMGTCQPQAAALTDARVPVAQASTASYRAASRRSERGADRRRATMLALGRRVCRGHWSQLCHMVCCCATRTVGAGGHQRVRRHPLPAGKPSRAEVCARRRVGDAKRRLLLTRRRRLHVQLCGVVDEDSRQLECVCLPATLLADELQPPESVSCHESCVG